MHPEKLEPLLESGHDLAVTHTERERAEGRQQQQPRLCKTSGSLTCLCRSLEAGLLAVCLSFCRDCLPYRLGSVGAFLNPALLLLTVNKRTKVKTEMAAGTRVGLLAHLGHVNFINLFPQDV